MVLSHVSASNTEADKTGAADREVRFFQIAYTVSDDLSLTYGEETFDLTGNRLLMKKLSGFGVSYTTGGMTLSAKTYKAEGAANCSWLKLKNGL